MVRAPRRPRQDEPAATPLELALYMERNGTWPRAERARFWCRPEVPTHLRPFSAPDPRRVLNGEDERLAYESDLALFKAERITWLEGQVYG